jgi:hypothetical protein
MGMDMSFAQRSRKRAPQQAVRLDLRALLAEIASRQADSPTARIQSVMERSSKNFSNFDPQAATFAPLHQEHKQRNSACFSIKVAGLITNRQHS